MARRPDTPCAGCGKLLWSGRTSLPAGERRCRSCRTAKQPGERYPRETRTCPQCGQQYRARTSSRARTCSLVCGQRYRHVVNPPSGPRLRLNRTCEICGVPYRWTYSKQRTCGRACGAVLQARGRPTPKPKPPPSVPEFESVECAYCSSALTRRKSAATPLCSPTCSGRYRRQLAGIPPAGTLATRSCVRCGATFEYLAGRGNNRRICSGCREVNRLAARREQRRKNPDTARNHRKRARKYGVPYEPVRSSYIYERDHWRCGICRKRIRADLRFPHPMSPSLDHVIPLSLGPGVSPGHVASNLQASHFICNSRKSAGTTEQGEQLMLVG